MMASGDRGMAQAELCPAVLQGPAPPPPHPSTQTHNWGAWCSSREGAHLEPHPAPHPPPTYYRSTWTLTPPGAPPFCPLASLPRSHWWLQAHGSAAQPDWGSPSPATPAKKGAERGNAASVNRNDGKLCRHAAACRGCQETTKAGTAAQGDNTAPTGCHRAAGPDTEWRGSSAETTHRRLDAAFHKVEPGDLFLFRLDWRTEHKGLVCAGLGVCREWGGKDWKDCRGREGL